MFYNIEKKHTRQKLGEYILLDWLNNYYLNIKLTIELNPSKFLDTKLRNISGAYKLNDFKNLPSPWTSNTPKRYEIWYEINMINGDLHLSKRILANFEKEISQIKEKFMRADCLLYFINSMVSEFQKGKECGDVTSIQFQFHQVHQVCLKPFIFIKIPYCELQWN